MVKICVSVPFESSVEYEIEVENPEDLEEIKERLRNTDPSDWRSDPNFYEEIGQNWVDDIEKIKKENVYIVNNSTVYTVKVGDEIYVGGLGDCIVVDWSNPRGIEVTRVKEEDNTISWQLLPDEHSDICLETVKVIPKQNIKQE